LQATDPVEFKDNFTKKILLKKSVLHQFNALTDFYFKPNDMIIDVIENIDRYVGLNPNFAKAFSFIHSTNLLTLENGKFDIDGDNVKAIVSESLGKKLEDSVAKFECHNQYLDIQICIKGKEMMGWKPRISCTTQNGEYNAAKDVLFYADAPDMYFQLTNGQFVIFFPEDVHAPMIGDDQLIKKIVLKVKI